MCLDNAINGLDSSVNVNLLFCLPVTVLGGAGWQISFTERKSKVHQALCVFIMYMMYKLFLLTTGF